MLVNDLVRDLEIARVFTCDAPTEECSKGEQVIGTLPDELKPLFVLMQKTKRELLSFADKFKARIEELGDPNKVPPEERVKLSSEFAYLESYYRLANQALWSEVRNAFRKNMLSPIRSLGIRKDWQVVAEEDKSPALLGIIFADA